MSLSSIGPCTWSAWGKMCVRVCLLPLFKLVLSVTSSLHSSSFYPWNWSTDMCSLQTQLKYAVTLIMHVSEHHWSIHVHSMSSSSVSVHQSMMLQRTNTIAHSNASCRHLRTKLSMTKTNAYLIEVCIDFGDACLWEGEHEKVDLRGVAYILYIYK